MNLNFYDDVQTIALIKALEGEELKFRVIILLTIFNGLRRGEVLGLEWQDIDFKNSSVTADSNPGSITIAAFSVEIR